MGGDEQALTSLADGADLLLTRMLTRSSPPNVAEYHDIPLAALHHLPMRPNGHLIPTVPSPLIRSAMTASDWVQWRMTKEI
jgi:hypothetical protein